MKCLAYDDSKYDLLWGRDENLLSAMVNGCKGAVGSTYNYAAPLYLSMNEYYKQGDIERAMWAPSVIENMGKYYFMWSEGGWTGPDYSVAYAIADSPFGPFKREGKILKQDPSIAAGAGHHSVIQIPGKDEYYIVYHRRPLGETDRNARVTCIDRLEFSEDGKISDVKMTREGVRKRIRM